MNEQTRLAIFILCSTLAFVLLLTPYRVSRNNTKPKQKPKQEEKPKRKRREDLSSSWWITEFHYGSSRRYSLLQTLPGFIPDSSTGGYGRIIAGPFTRAEAEARLYTLQAYQVLWMPGPGPALDEKAKHDD